MRTRLLLAATAVAALVFLPACHRHRPPAVNTAPPGGATTPAERTAPPTYGGAENPQGPDVRAIPGEGATSEDFTISDPNTGEGGPLEDVRFDYDSASLNEQGRSLLEKHGLWLQNHRQAKVLLEGHCDERGTAEYNLALGEQRARAVFDYLRNLGVTAERLRTVSYGKEKPLDPGHNEAAWARNRRVHFNVSR